MGNYCSTEDKDLNEFSKFYKTNKDYIVTETHLSNLAETRDTAFLENLLNKKRNKVFEKMSKMNNFKKYLENFKKKKNELHCKFFLFKPNLSI